MQQLELEQYTLAEIFKDADYVTIFLGKWRLGKQQNYFPRRSGLPWKSAI